jgi:thymidine kinase
VVKAAYRKMLRCTNNDETRILGRYLDTVDCKWFNHTKELLTYKYKIEKAITMTTQCDRKVATRSLRTEHISSSPSSSSSPL